MQNSGTCTRILISQRDTLFCSEEPDMEGDGKITVPPDNKRARQTPTPFPVVCKNHLLIIVVRAYTSSDFLIYLCGHPAYRLT